MTAINVEIDSKQLMDAYQRVDLPSTFNKVVTSVNTLTNKVQVNAKEAFEKLQYRLDTASLEPIFAFINRNCTEVEKIFNVVSCIPFIGVIGSAVRMIAGKIQLIAGIILAGVAQIGVLVESRKEGESSLRHKWQALTKLGFEHVLHGCLNVLRGLGETVLATSTLGFGNVALLVPNLINNREFAPYFTYGTLANSS